MGQCNVRKENPTPAVRTEWPPGQDPGLDERRTAHPRRPKGSLPGSSTPHGHTWPPSLLQGEFPTHRHREARGPCLTPPSTKPLRSHEAPEAGEGTKHEKGECDLSTKRRDERKGSRGLEGKGAPSGRGKDRSSCQERREHLPVAVLSHSWLCDLGQPCHVSEHSVLSYLIG